MLINEEISNQMSRKLNEIKNSLDFQIQNAITEKILPSIQNRLVLQGRTNCTMVDRGSTRLHDSPKSTNFITGDRRSSELQRSPEVENALKAWEIALVWALCKEATD